MILYAALFGVRISGDVEHVFDPVGAVGNLNLPPIVVGVLEAAVPVHAEAEEIPVEAIFGRAVLDDEAGVKHARADLFGGSSEHAARVKLHEGDRITFGVVKNEMRDATDIPGNRADRDIVGKEVAMHPGDVACGKGDFGEQVCGRGRDHF